MPKSSVNGLKRPKQVAGAALGLFAGSTVATAECISNVTDGLVIDVVQNGLDPVGHILNLAGTPLIWPAICFVYTLHAVKEGVRGGPDAVQKTFAFTQLPASILFGLNPLGYESRGLAAQSDFDSIMRFSK